MKKCTSCKKDRNEEEYRTRKNGSINKCCNQCIETGIAKYAANKEERQKYQRERYHRPDKKQALLDYQNQRHADNPQYIGNYFRERKKTDALFKLRVEASARVNMYLKRKKDVYIEEIGCTTFELKKYVESLFLPGMTWENKGRNGWHVDHIFPLSAAQKGGEEVLKRAFNYRNIRPLWEKDNWSKFMTLPIEWPSVEEFMKATASWVCTNPVQEVTDLVT